jgi:hypothetical protein
LASATDTGKLAVVTDVINVIQTGLGGVLFAPTFEDCGLSLPLLKPILTRFNVVLFTTPVDLSGQLSYLEVPLK